MGASNGGRIAVDFALEHPEKVDALVLVRECAYGCFSWCLNYINADISLGTIHNMLGKS